MTTAVPALGFMGSCLSRSWYKIDPHRSRYFPLGLPTLGAGDHAVRRVNSVSRFTRFSKLSNRTSPCSKRSIRGIRLHRLWRRSRATDYFNWQHGMPREHRSVTDDRNVLLARSRLLCRVVGPVLARNFRDARHSSNRRHDPNRGPESALVVISEGELSRSFPG